MKKKTLGVLVALLLLAGAGVYTYAKYTTTFSGNATATVAKWSVNLTSAGESLNKTFDLPLTLTENANVAEGKIAPGVNASGTIELDLTGTEVSTNYTITVGEITNVPTGVTVSVKVGETELTEATDGTFTGSITHEEIATNPKVQVVVTITWPAEGNDASDTQAGESPVTLSIPLTVKAEQKTN